MHFHNLTIHQVTKVTSQAVELVLSLPDALKTSFTYKSGQYLTLRATINGVDTRRAYSMSSAPQDGVLTVVVKAVEKGVFSNYAMTLRAGESIQVAEPKGFFVHEPVIGDILLIAAGSGITPIFSLLKTYLAQSTHNVALLYGNQSVSQTIYYEQLNDLQDQYGDRFKLTYCFSREDRDAALFGRVSKSNLNYFLKQHVSDFAFAKAYLCGPEEMIHMVSDNLIEQNILTKEAINFELFTTTDAKMAITEDGYLTELTVILDDEKHVIVMKRNETMLDVMLKNDIDAPYSCQGGICSSCVGVIEQGTTTMLKNNILTDGEIVKGLTLTCQARPTSAQVTVNFDEV
jgi:ring-1,2-phenylacetyl-CoA epoxidase subunit PaaE